jgi:hypothetical protein
VRRSARTPKSVIAGTRSTVVRWTALEGGNGFVVSEVLTGRRCCVVDSRHTLKPDRRLSAVIRVSTEFGGAISCCSDSLLPLLPCIAQVRLWKFIPENRVRRPDVPWYPSNLERRTVNGVPCAQNASCCVRLACR